MNVVDSTLTARKRHWCEVCPDPIEPGASYVRVVTFDGGDVLTWKAHHECQDATEQARADGYGDSLDGTILGSDVVEWATENWHLKDAAATIYHRYQRRNHEETSSQDQRNLAQRLHRHDDLQRRRVPARGRTHR